MVELGFDNIFETRKSSNLSLREILQGACESGKSVSNQRRGSHEKQGIFLKDCPFPLKSRQNHRKVFRVSLKWLSLPRWNNQEF